MTPATPRTLKLRPYAKAPDGTHLCRVCGGPCSGRRTSFCSHKCDRAYRDQQPGHLRFVVEQRDHGICAACEIDCKALAGWLERLGARVRRGGDVPDLRAYREAAAQCRAFGLPADSFPHYRVRALWEADHVVPLAEGGANTVENLRTLCVRCHKRASAEGAARRARARRAGAT